MLATSTVRWAVSLAATAASTYALDAVATVAGVGLVASGAASGLGRPAVLLLLAGSYVVWALGLRVNLLANWDLLERTGTSTNAVSKGAHDLVARRSGSRRLRRVATDVGYVGTELVKELPYYVGAFGATIVVDDVSSTDALVFLAGANLGAAAYEYGLAGLTHVFLRRRQASFDTDWVPAEYLADYYRDVEPDERETIAFFVAAVRAAEPGRPVLFFGVGPTLHHVFLAAPTASEIHLGDYLPANLAEIRRWLDRDPGAHDWRPFVRYTLVCEGVEAPTEQQVAAREELTRSRVTRLLVVDGRTPDPSAGQYATVVSAYCADSATDGHATWAPFMQNILARVQPGGLFLTAALRRCEGYLVGGKEFPSARVDEGDVRGILESAFGPLAGTVQVRELTAQPDHGYSGIILACARRPALVRVAAAARPARPARPALLTLGAADPAGVSSRLLPTPSVMSNPTLPAAPTSSPDPSLALVGSDLTVPLVTGGRRRYVNLDYAASAPCLVRVKEAVDELLPWYSSVHRGAGYKSALTTDAYEGARDAVRTFVGARGDDVAVFTRNTTDAVNVLAAALPEDCAVVGFAVEHHANLLPWRRHDVTLLPAPAGPAEALERLEETLTRRAAGRDVLVSVTGASNVTGEIWPYAQLAEVAHRHGARVMLDAAQLAPHRAIDMTAAGVDYLALSGHKLYAPFGAGVLVGRPDWLGARAPFLAGGGAVRYVGTDTVVWSDLPDRQEAGTPNVIGAVALGVACRTLEAADRTGIAATEDALLDETRQRLAAVPGVAVYRLWPAEYPRIAVLPFALDTLPYAQLAAALSAEHGIGVRHGCFCAHPLMVRLLGLDPAQEARLRDRLGRGLTTALPGAVRASAGLGTTRADLTALVDAVAELAARGPRWTYGSSADASDSWPEPDPRPRPGLPFDLARSPAA